jgi:hypothetical protein
MIVHHEVVEQHWPEEYLCQPAAQDSTRSLELNSTGTACSKLDF